MNLEPLRMARSRARLLLWDVRRLLRLPPADPRETQARTSRLARRMTRCTPGRCRTSFGVVRFADAASFHAQHYEMFVDRQYDFRSARPDPFILDVGGNIGMSVLRFKQIHPASRIVTFEPDPDLCDILQANLEAAGLKDVELVRAAAWSSRGELPFVRDGADSGHVAPAGADARVPSVRLADWVRGDVDLLKMDVEGAEFEILEDLDRSGALLRVRQLIVEVHGRGGSDARVGDLWSILVRAGFRVCASFARAAVDLVGDPLPTPFPGCPDGKFLLHLHAWREAGGPCASS